MKPKRACKATFWDRVNAGPETRGEASVLMPAFKRKRRQLAAHREKMARKKEYRSQFRGDYYRPHPAHFEGGYGAPLERGGLKRRELEAAHRRATRWFKAARNGEPTRRVGFTVRDGDMKRRAWDLGCWYQRQEYLRRWTA